MTELEKAFSFLSEAEAQVLKSFSKVIIWGFPLNSHTHSYIHYCWVRTFRAFGKEVHWFHDKEFADPKQFSYENCLFITEGYAEKQIPLCSSSVYFVHNCINPYKYQKTGARVIEIRFQVNEIHDLNNDFILTDGTHHLEALSEDVQYEICHSTKDLSKLLRGPVPENLTYEAIYMFWPTDLFPWEIDLKDAEYIPDKKEIHYVGTPYKNKRLDAFRQEAEANGIQWIWHNPWEKPISFEENRELVKQSIVAPDFRPQCTEVDLKEFGEKNGKDHLAIGYIPCRLSKNISYGHIPLTDSPHAFSVFGDAVVFDKDLEMLLKKGIEAQKDVERKRRAMKYVAEHHTYVQRVRDLMRCLLKPRPQLTTSEPVNGTWRQCTFVTSLININREQYDGRTFQEYISWFLHTITIPAPMIIYCEPVLVNIVHSIRGSLPTKIIAQNLQTCPLGWSLPFIQDILTSENFRQKMKYPNDLTNKCAGYAAVTNSKYAWLLNAMDANPFKTDLFFWIDAGLSRFWTHINPLDNEPHIELLLKLRQKKQIFALAAKGKDQVIEQIFQGKRFTQDELIGTNMNLIMTGFFGGDVETMKVLCKKMLQNYSSEMIMKHRIDHDQASIISHFQENPDCYQLLAAHPQLDAFNFVYFAKGDLYVLMS